MAVHAFVLGRESARDLAARAAKQRHQLGQGYPIWSGEVAGVRRPWAHSRDFANLTPPMIRRSGPVSRQLVEA